jgi:hypothetical protein
MNSYTFDDEYQNLIKMYGENESIYIDYFNINPKNGKMFVILLKKSFDTVITDGYTKHRQYVKLQDWDDFLCKKIEWMIIKNDGDALLIECDIEFAVHLIVEAFMNV